MNEWIKRWNRYWFEPKELHGLALFRAALGLIFFFYFLARVPHAAALYSDEALRYVSPFFRGWDLPYLSSGGVAAVLAAVLTLSLMFAAGFLTRLSNALLLVGAVYLGALESAYAAAAFHLMVISLFLLLFSPCGRWGSVDAVVFKKRAAKGPVWAARLIVFQLAVVYFSSALSKLLHAPGWYDGEFIRSTFLCHFFGQTAIGLWLESLPFLLPALGMAGLFLELFLPVFLLAPRYAFVAVGLGTLFHLLVFLTMRVTHFFLFVMLAHYILVLPPAFWKRQWERGAKMLFAKTGKKTAKKAKLKGSEA